MPSLGTSTSCYLASAGVKSMQKTCEEGSPSVEAREAASKFREAAMGILVRAAWANGAAARQPRCPHSEQERGGPLLTAERGSINLESSYFESAEMRTFSKTGAATRAINDLVEHVKRGIIAPRTVRTKRDRSITSCQYNHAKKLQHLKCVQACELLGTGGCKNC